MRTDRWTVEQKLTDERRPPLEKRSTHFTRRGLGGRIRLPLAAAGGSCCLVTRNLHAQPRYLEVLAVIVPQVDVKERKPFGEA
ncbi:MAG: hypothetical protein AABX70_08365 [Nanoarchaeota archaeon]